MGKSKIVSDEWYQYEYLMECTISIPGEEDYHLTDLQLEGLYLEKDFDNDHLPVMLLDVNIPAHIDDKIGDDALVTLNVTSYIKDTQNPDMVMDKQKIISGVFSILEPDGTPDQEYKLRQMLRELSGSDDEDVMLEDTAYKATYILINKEMSTLARTIVNNVMTNVDLVTAYAYLLSSVNAKNVLLSNFDNVDVIPELLLLPIPLLNELTYLSNYYGLHKEGTQIFLDLDTLYINRMNGKCTCWRENEIKNVTFFIGDIMQPDNTASGCVQTEDTIYVNVDRSSYTITDGKLAMDQLSGRNVMVYDESTMMTSTVDTGGEFETMQSTYGHNKYLDTQIAARKKEDEKVVHLMLSYIDVSWMTPNKQYRIITDDTVVMDDVAGDYRLSMMNTTFIREGGHFLTVTMVELKRVGD